VLDIENVPMEPYFFLSEDDREMYISTGKGIKHILTDSYLLSVIEHIRYYLRQEEYDSGILDGVKRIIYRLKNQNLCSRSSPDGVCPEGECCFEGRCDSAHCLNSDIPNPIVSFIFFGLIICFIAYSCYSSLRDRSRRNRDRQRLDRLREEFKQKKKIPTPLCAICLVDFEGDQSTESKKTDVEQKDRNNNKSTDDNEEEKSNLRNRKNTKEQVSKNKEEKLEKPETLVCGHQFHTTCLNAWLRVNDSCPVCRQDHPRDPPSSDNRDHKNDSDKFDSFSQSDRQAVFDDEVLTFAYSRLSVPQYYERWTPYDPSSSDSSDSGFGGGDSGGGGGAGGSW